MYDVVIIGAGIGGLVCGCYLAKAGMKVLIVEQHNKTGGYCTSFKRKGFTFDAAPHCFGSYREGGMMKKILQDLEVDNLITMIRPEPSDMIITPDYKIPIWNNLEKTIREFQKNFPMEGYAIEDFFHLLISTDPSSFSMARKLNFKELLDKYFTDNKLKTILSYPLLAISGLPPYLLSAFVGAKLYSEFIFDGGYYPEGGMQALPNALSEKFREFGGELKLSSLVEKIKTKNEKVTGVVLKEGDFISSKYVISNCDARQTFFKLLGKTKVKREFSNTLKNMMPSMSNFILYIGIDGDFKPLQNVGTACYFFPHYDLEKAYHAVKKGDFNGYGGYAFRISHDKSTIYAGMPAPYKNTVFWKNNKYKLLDSFIERLEKYSMPYLSEHIIYKDAATPHTMYRYTLNYKGASYGWAGIPSQLIISELKNPSFIQGLYLAGHWTTFGVGISGAAYVGCEIAKTISRRQRQN